MDKNCFLATELRTKEKPASKVFRHRRLRECAEREKGEREREGRERKRETRLEGSEG